MEIYTYKGKIYYIFEKDIDEDNLINFINNLHKLYNLINYGSWVDKENKISPLISYISLKARYKEYGYLVFELEQRDDGKYNLYHNSSNNFSNVYREYQESKFKRTEITINKIEDIIRTYETNLL
jgi:hypothetical protein